MELTNEQARFLLWIWKMFDCKCTGADPNNYNYLVNCIHGDSCRHLDKRLEEFINQDKSQFKMDSNYINKEIKPVIERIVG